ncbi:MAG TPA: hypothetical protein VIJ17_13040 [Pseudolabrys sp.]|jgi:putative ABC transport system ATP-binding protein
MPQPSSASPGLMFRAHALSKTYVMGEVAVHALREINLDIYEREFVARSADRAGSPPNNRC